MDQKSAPKKRSIGKIIGFAFGILVLLLVVLFFAVTSAGFVKSFILPRVSKSLNATVTVSDASVSLFSQVVLRGLRVQTTGAEPLLTADEARVRYHLMDIIGGNIKLDEVTLLSPTIQIIKETNATSNLDPLLKSDNQKPAAATKPGKPSQVNVSNIHLQNGTVRQIEKMGDGGRKITELSAVDLSIDRFQNGQPGKLTLSSAIKLDNQIGAVTKSPTNDILIGKASGNFDFLISPDLKPQTIKGSSRLDFSRGEGAFLDMANLTGKIDCDLTPTEAKQISLVFEKQGKEVGRIQAKGPLDLANSEGRLNIEILSIDRQALNLAGASKGFDFGTTTLNSSNIVTLTQKGAALAASGQVSARNFSLEQKGQRTLPLDLNLRYEVEVNLSGKTALVKVFDITAKQQNRDLLSSALDKPMSLNWGANSQTVPDSSFQLTLTNFNVADWKALIGTNAPEGTVNAQLKLSSQRDGKLLKADLAAEVNQLRLSIGGKQIDPAQVKVDASGSIQEMKIADFPQFHLLLSQQGQPVLNTGGAVHYNLSTKSMEMRITADGSLPSLLRIVPMTNVQATAGTLKANLVIGQTNLNKQITGAIALNGFSGNYTQYHFQNLTTTADVDVAILDQEARISKAALRFQQNNTEAGAIDLSGKYNLSSKAGQLAFTVANLNQNFFQPILAPSLGNNKLVSITLNGSGAANYNPTSETSIKTALSVTNWVVESIEKNSKTPPLAASLSVEGAMRQQVLDLKQFGITLTPTDRAKNELQIKGHLDLGKTNPTPSTLSIDAESLDVTPYYDMFAGKATNTATAPTSSPVAVVTETKGETIPAPLPIERLTAQLKIARLFLRQVVVSNWVATAELNKGNLVLDPCQLFLNGGPVTANAKINLAIAGYGYDIAFKTDRVPLQPLVSSFSSDTRLQKGELVSQGTIKGVGSTGTSLKKTLQGQATVSLTNLDLQVISPKLHKLLDPIALVLRTPELSQTPLSLIDAKTELGDGKINLSRFHVASPAFLADAHGVIPIDDILTNSPLNLPVELSLLRSIAQKSNLLPADAATNAMFVSLPSFVTIKGTLGDPKSDINKGVISGLLLRSVTGMIPGAGGTTGSLLQGVGGLLSGTHATNTPSSTDLVNTNKTANEINKVFRGLGNLLNTTNTAGTNSVNNTNKAARPNLLDLFKK